MKFRKACFCTAVSIAGELEIGAHWEKGTALKVEGLKTPPACRLCGTKWTQENPQQGEKRDD